MESGNTNRFRNNFKTCWFWRGGSISKSYKIETYFSGISDFLYEDDFDAILAIADAVMLHNDEE